MARTAFTVHPSRVTPCSVTGRNAYSSHLARHQTRSAKSPPHYSSDSAVTPEDFEPKASNPVALSFGFLVYQYVSPLPLLVSLSHFSAHPFLFGDLAKGSFSLISCVLVILDYNDLVCLSLSFIWDFRRTEQLCA